MNINQAFFVAYPVAQVWDLFRDVRAVASCMPGMKLYERYDDGRYRGEFNVRVGPIVASFHGDVEVETNDDVHSGVIRGQGLDGRTSTRVRSELHYRVSATDTGARVEISGDYALAGSLAQFARRSLMEDVANRLTLSFAEALRELLSESCAGKQPADPAASEVVSVSDTGPAVANSGPRHVTRVWRWLRRWPAHALMRRRKS
jgi:carbon monoxide dehydrogenase subunit G